MKRELLKTNDYFSTAHLHADVKNRAIRGAGATIFANAVSFLVHFLSTIILGRLLTPNDFGLVAMVTTFSLLFQNFGVNGFTEAIIQKEDLDHDTMSTLFWLNAAISSSLTVVFMLMGPLLVWFYGEPHLNLIVIGVAFSIIMGAMSTLHMGILRRNMKFHLTSGIEVVARTASIVVAVFLACFGWGYWALVANTVTYPLVVAIGGWTFCGWRPASPSSGTKILSILTFAFHTYGNFALNYFSRNIDKLLIGWRYAAQSLGYYKKAYDLFALPANQLVAPLANVALAALSRLTDEPDKYRRCYLDALSILAFVGMPLSAMLTLSGIDIILLVLGPQWTKAGEIFCYFGASIGIMLIYGTQGWLHLSLGRPDRWVRWGFFECIATSAFFVCGLPFGSEGVAIGYALSFYVLTAPCLYYAGKPIDLRLSSLLSVVWKYFASAFGAGSLSFVILHSNDIGYFFNCLNVFLRIVAASTLCLSFYLLFVIGLHRSYKPISNFISLVRMMVSRPHCSSAS